MASITIPDINQSINNSKDLLDCVETGNLHSLLEELNFDWTTRSVNTKAFLYEILQQRGYLESNGTNLNRQGILFISRLTLDFRVQFPEGALVSDRYRVISPLHVGKNSATFKAEHQILGTQVVLKFVRPGAGNNISKSLKKISSLGLIPGLVQPIDFFSIDISDVFLNSLSVDCVVFSYVEGVTLREFLKRDRQPLNAHFIASFIKKVSTVLADLEDINAYHGDLHEENIIVNCEKGRDISFNIIDVSFGINGSSDSAASRDNDLAYFRQHVWGILSAQQKFLRKMSVRKYLGSELYHVIAKILASETKSFKTIKSLFENHFDYGEYKRRKKEFIEKKFNPPGQFKLQRYEEITDPAVALKLFVPFPELMDNIKSFSNLIVTGNRGSGKSTYLAALAFFPRVDKLIMNYRNAFGVYFPCRQGEFRIFSPDMIDYSSYGTRRVKHVFVIKVIRRTLEAIAEGLEYGRLSEPKSYDNLKDKLSIFLEAGEFISLDGSVVSEARNLLSMIVRIEMKETDSLFDSSALVLTDHLANETDLIEFFEILRDSFSELSGTKFHLLFDDAGTPHIPTEAQRIINDLMVSSNPIVCVKLSAEKYSYDYQTTTKKQLESGHDFFEYDIPNIFFVGSKTVGLKQDELEAYSRKIVAKRLEQFEYKSTDIVDYLGDDQAKANNLINSLANSRRNAYYCGWNMVWKIADRTPRNLFELISEIFSVANIDNQTEPYHIENRNQDRAIRAVSERRLRSISQISGTIDLYGEEVSLGRKLFDLTSSIGSVFRIYLKEEKGKKRKAQYLAIERNDTTSLSYPAESILREAIRYGMLDESRLEYARDDNVKKPIYVLNRIYCPAFSIGLVRDQHLRLSHLKFEEMLIEPVTFVKDGTKRLRDRANSGGISIEDMFSEKYDD